MKLKFFLSNKIGPSIRRASVFLFSYKMDMDKFANIYIDNLCLFLINNNKREWSREK
jgi:hypothetical protein